VWIKIWVENYYCICRVKVDANATSPSGKQIYKDFGIWLVELVHALLPGGLFRPAILIKESVANRL
jgi:hypothetical protein